MSADKQRIEIVRGHGKHEVHAQAYDWGRPYPERRVFLLVLRDPASTKGRTRKIQVATYILGIEEAQGEDSEFETDANFSLTGIISVDPKNCRRYGYSFEKYPWLEPLQDFTADYDTRTRTGIIEPL